MRFIVRVRRTIIETCELEIEAPDEDSAWEIAEDESRGLGMGNCSLGADGPTWNSDPTNDSDYEVTDVEEA